MSLSVSSNFTGKNRTISFVYSSIYLSFSLSLSQRVQKNFEGKLIGADRAKDLAVLKVCLLSEVFLNACHLHK